MTLSGKSKAELQECAKVLAPSHELVYHRGDLYLPVNYETAVPQVGQHETTMWLAVDMDDIREMSQQAGILFQSPQEENNFIFMLEQLATPVRTVSSDLFVKTKGGLRVLRNDGVLVESDGAFRPNCLAPVLVEDDALKDEVFNVFVDWLGDEEEAHSLLHHLATALAPGWSAVKYVLLLGEGRNGKGVLLEMLSQVFGPGNISNITRQEISALSPTVTALNNKLLNLVFDGPIEYIKDSGPEKTLIAGESAMVRKLYRSEATRVQSNALFIEALNREPKSRDKSAALQKRLARFWFPNVYELNNAFRNRMLHPDMLGAFLAVLIDHFVQENELAEKLTPTRNAEILHLTQVWVNSPVMQFLGHLYKQDPKNLDLDRLEGAQIDPLVDAFMTWRKNEGYTEFSSADSLTMFKEFFEVTRKTFRVKGKPTTQRAIKSVNSLTKQFIAHLSTETENKEHEDEAKLLEGTVVED